MLFTVIQKKGVESEVDWRRIHVGQFIFDICRVMHYLSNIKFELFCRYYKKYGLEKDNLIDWLSDQLQSDAPYLSSLCDLSEFPCKDGNDCIPVEQVCDNKSQCPDGSDELYCAKDEGSNPDEEDSSEEDSSEEDTNQQPGTVDNYSLVQ